ncbi:MAG: F0F1 ATP synthase subunit gamma, partial [Bacteroidales bacterium]|nr:F0F1 ATP synthase subunit gamma [Bacteroidales bacterium]
MSSLREVKDRIASVRSTLKITSAMKLVASSKLRKAQRTIEALRPYEATLTKILSSLPPVQETPVKAGDDGLESVMDGTDQLSRTIVLAISSNQSMCGAFNANVIKRTMDTLAGM